MEAVQYKCLNCGAGLIFDPDKQDFICEYCDSVFKEQDFFDKDQKLDTEIPDKSENDGFENALLYICPSCGAEVVTDETTAATTCYYCSNPVVLSGKLSGEFKPDNIIPFKIDKNDAIAKFKELCGKKKFLPKNFIAESRLEEIKGVYFPYWYIDGEADGNINATSKQVRSWMVGDMRHTETVIRGHFRQGNLSVRNMPEAALKSKDRDILRYVCPFNSADFVQFSMSYLSGFFAEKRDVEIAEIQSSVDDKIKSYSRKKLLQSIEYPNVSAKDSSIKIDNLKWSYNLLPVWVLTYKHKNKNYIYALNGQTGKVYGEMPVSNKKLAALFAGVTAAAAVILSVISEVLL